MKKRIIPGMFSSVPMAEVVTKLELAAEHENTEETMTKTSETDNTTE